MASRELQRYRTIYKDGYVYVQSIYNDIENNHQKYPGIIAPTSITTAMIGELNASAIKSGVLDVDKIRVGNTSTFKNGYNQKYSGFRFSKEEYFKNWTMNELDASILASSNHLKIKESDLLDNSYFD